MPNIKIVISGIYLGSGRFIGPNDKIYELVRISGSVPIGPAELTIFSKDSKEIGNFVIKTNSGILICKIN